MNIQPDLSERRAFEHMAFELRVQRILAQCPGLVGFDAPKSASCAGKVVIEPAQISTAMNWLRRRFEVNESIELSDDTGLVVLVKARTPTVRGPQAKRVRCKWPKAEQFTFDL